MANFCAANAGSTCGMMLVPCRIFEAFSELCLTFGPFYSGRPDTRKVSYAPNISNCLPCRGFTLAGRVEWPSPAILWASSKSCHCLGATCRLPTVDRDCPVLSATSNVSSYCDLSDILFWNFRRFGAEQRHDSLKSYSTHVL